MIDTQLERTTHALAAEGRGILAADESTGTMSARLEAAGIESSQESRRAYRAVLLSTSGLGEYVSGVILFDETLRQRLDDGTPFPEAIARAGMVPGIKVDIGAKPLAGAPGEKVTEGLDGLRERLLEYGRLGARFAKWRGVLAIGDGLPSAYCISVNADALARYAALCQEAGIVPIVEPEVLMDGAHTLDHCASVTSAVLNAVFAALRDQRVSLEHMLLKPNMVLPGRDCPQQAGVDEVASATLRCLRAAVPAAVPAIVFLSGGQGPQLASAHLNAINTMGPQPWILSFSYGRALQDPALAAWQGDQANRELAQTALRHRAMCNSAACVGRYSPDMELEPVA